MEGCGGGRGGSGAALVGGYWYGGSPTASEDGRFVLSKSPGRMCFVVTLKV